MTLIEVMVTMVIMALVSAAAGFAVVKVYQDVLLRQAKQDANVIRQAAGMYLIEHGECPSATELAQSETLEGRDTDPWGQDYRIECPDGRPTVISAGPDGQFETEDDVG